MITKNELKQQFYEYLSDTFGPKFTAIIEPPEGVMIGERVLYKLRNGQTAQRNEMTQKDTDELHQMIINVAEESGGVALEAEPPITSGLP